MTLSEIHDSQPGAAGRTVATAADAEHLGYANVETGYQPQTGMHTVTGDYPDTAARRLVDSLLGR
jgi:hypothetical protein